MTTQQLILAAAFCAITATAQAGGRQPIPVPGDPCPRSYHQEQVTRNGWGFSGNIGGGYGPINGGVQLNAPQYTQRYQQCVPNEQRNMGNRPMPMPRPSGYQIGPPGPMANSTPMWIRRY